MTGDYIRLTSNIESGLSPLEVLLEIDGTSNITNSNINASYIEPNQVAFLEATILESRVLLTGAGTYYFTVNATDYQGNTYSDTVAITVLDRTELDTLLRVKWDGMKTALLAGDVEGALEEFNESSKEMYRYNFELMQSILPSIAQDMGEIVLIEIEDGVAKYEVLVTQGGTEYSFYIEFIKGIDGIWEIRFF